MAEEDDDEEVPPLPQRNQDDTDEDGMNESGTEASESTHEDGSVHVNGIAQHPA